MNISYPYKVWFATLLLGPLFWIITQAYVSGFFHFGIFLYIIFHAVVLGWLFSLPAFFLFYLLHNDLRFAELKPIWKKLILAMVAQILLVLTVVLLDAWVDSEMDQDAILLIASFGAALFISVFIFRIGRRNPSEGECI